MSLHCSVCGAQLETLKVGGWGHLQGCARTCLVIDAGWRLGDRSPATPPPPGRVNALQELIGASSLWVPRVSFSGGEKQVVDLFMTWPRPSRGIISPMIYWSESIGHQPRSRRGNIAPPPHLPVERVAISVSEHGGWDTYIFAATFEKSICHTSLICPPGGLCPGEQS